MFLSIYIVVYIVLEYDIYNINVVDSLQFTILLCNRWATRMVNK